MRYRELTRKVLRDLKVCIKAGAPEWLVGYAKASMAKADYFHSRRRSVTCSSRSLAMGELLRLGDVLRHYLMSVSAK